MRVLFVTAGDQRMSGVVRYDREVVNGLRALGLEVRVFTPPYTAGNGDGSRRLDEARFFLKQARRGFATHGGHFKQTFGSFLAEYRPDVVHMSLDTALIFSSLAGQCAAMGIPVVGTQHQPTQKSNTLLSATLQVSYRMVAFCIRHLARLIVFSQDQQECMLRAGYPAARLVIVPNGVDADKFSPGASQFRAELDADCVLLFLGRFAYQKGTDLLLEAFDECTFGPRVKLAMVGGGDGLSDVRRRYGHRPDIYLPGVIRDEARVIDILRGSDIFVQPSRYEGLSISLLEAMSTGVACITSAVGGHRDVVAGAGLLLEPQHLRPQLRLALQTLVGNRELCRLLGRQARQRIVERYSLNHMLNRLVALYEEVIAQSAPALADNVHSPSSKERNTHCESS